MTELTQLLQKVQAGDASARDALFAATYPTLEKLARARLRDGGRNTLLDTRGVVHESYVRYVQGGTLRAADRRAFFAFISHSSSRKKSTCELPSKMSSVCWAKWFQALK